MIFLNLTQHELTKEMITQIKKINEEIEIINFKEDNEKLFKKIGNITFPDRLYIDYLVDELIEYIEQFGHRCKYVYALLPIGSPYFMFLFALKVRKLLKFHSHIKILFAHSDRIVKEEGNKKIVTFQFKNFLTV